MSESEVVSHFSSDKNQKYVELALALFLLVKKGYKKAEKQIEIVKKWGAPIFVYNGKNICSIFITKKFVRATFFFGYDLGDDPDFFNHCFDAKTMKTRRFESLSDLMKEKFINYIARSISIAQTRKKS